MSRITSTTPLNAIVTRDSSVNIVRKVDCHNFKTLLRTFAPKNFPRTDFFKTLTDDRK